MSYSALANATRTLTETTAQAAWRQWSAVFSLATADRSARALVDPEALLLVSMALAEDHPRVWSAGPVWAVRGSRLLSVQRTKNLAESFPPTIAPRLNEFASLAMNRGNDKRWRSLVTEPLADRPKSRKESFAPRVSSPPALMLRLRLGLGVGIKADVLAYLIGLAGAASTVQEIANATAYFGRAVRRSVEELAAAGFVESRASAPISYRANIEEWAQLLDFDANDPPVWRAWALVYAFVAAVLHWVPTMSSKSEPVVASRARDLWNHHRPALDVCGVRDVPSSRYPGSEFLQPFIGALEQTAERIEDLV